MSKPKTPPPMASTPPVKSPRANTKMAGVIALLERDGGATIADLRAFTGWQEHSVRGVLAGILKRRFGLQISSQKTEAGRFYTATRGQTSAS